MARDQQVGTNQPDSKGARQSKARVAWPRRLTEGRRAGVGWGRTVQNRPGMGEGGGAGVVARAWPVAFGGAGRRSQFSPCGVGRGRTPGLPSSGLAVADVAAVTAPSRAFG